MKRKRLKDIGVIAAFYRDNLVKLVVDVPDLAKNRRWMKAFKARWKERLEQHEIWVISYRVEVE